MRRPDAPLRWITSSVRSISGILFQHEQVEDPATEAHTEEVRGAMLNLMASAGLEIRHREMCSRIRYADSLRSLWYARSDLIAALADAHGEAFAQQRLAAVSRQFVGLLPEARHYRSPRTPR